mgnify:CR=1 FL=1
MLILMESEVLNTDWAWIGFFPGPNPSQLTPGWIVQTMFTEIIDDFTDLKTKILLKITIDDNSEPRFHWFENFPKSRISSASNFTKKIATRLRRVFFHILSSQIDEIMVDCRVRLNSKINFSAVCTANSQRKNAQQRWKIRRRSRLETPLWACISRNRYELCMPTGI